MCTRQTGPVVDTSRHAGLTTCHVVASQRSTAIFMQADQAAQAEGAAKPAAAAAAAHDPIAGALQRFGLKHASRPVGVAKIDLASSFTDASSPAVALSSAASKPAAASEQWLIMHAHFALCCHGVP